MKPVTISEIAKHAGVSIKTVSRVLNKEPNVREKTRDKVLAVAKKLKYRPNFSARSLASNKSFVIAHWHNNANSDYTSRVLDGAHKACKTAGYFVVGEQLSPPYKNSARAYLDTYRVDGIILSAPLTDDAELLQFLQEQEIPFARVSPGTQTGISPAAHIDNCDSANRMTKLLIDAGHKHIAFICGPPNHIASKLRQDGFQVALKGAGLNLENCPVYVGDFSVKSGFEAYTNQISKRKDVSAIFAANDAMAVGVVMAALKHGVRVPDDLAIVGFDGSQLSQTIWPQLTTLYQPVSEMTQAITHALLTEIKTGKIDYTPMTFDTHILRRDTM
mgnify:CR=1 FL=1